MAAAGETLIAQPLRAEGAFNWIYLVDWIVIGVLSLFFLFYFNRVFATVVSYCIRLYTWRAFGVWIDIEALQFSPLAGRLFFKGIRYHGDNETVFVHSGNVTWRYWLLKTKTARIFQKEGAVNDDEATKRETGDEEADERQEKTIEADLGIGGSLPCRISVKVSGVEAFIYNRGPAYDFIVEGIQRREESVKKGATQYAGNQNGEKASASGFHHVDTYESSSSENDKLAQAPGSSSDDSPLRWQQSANSRPSSDTAGWQNEEASAKRLQPPALLRLLPIHVECQKAAAVLGNDNTSSVISAKVDSAHGEFDASESGPLDIFRILMGFEVAQPYIQMKPNVDYREPQLAEATEIKRQEEQEEVEIEGSKLSKFGRMSSLFNLPHWASKSLESVTVRPHKSGRMSGMPYTQLRRHRQNQWQGLARYLDENEPNEWHDVEYAKSSVIADLDMVGFQFYWDIAGPVPELHESYRDAEGREGSCDINSATPPAYGMQLIVQGGYVTYGPWADRNRLVLQQIFFPTQFADAVPATPLEVGQPRLCTVFKLDLHVSEDTVLRIPFREPSKDGSWKGRAAALTRQNVANDLNKKSRSRRHSVSNNSKGSSLKAADSRPFAWFDIRVKPGTSVHFEQDMFPREGGYTNNLVVDVSSVEIYSSLNHALLWRSRKTGVSADLSYPLAWNGLRDWTFNLEINHLDFFLLRDHTFLLVDLIEDWSRGPLPDFFTFIPFRYKLNVHFHDFKLYLNTNDANIIDNSDDLEENEFVILYGKTVDALLEIPLTHFRPAEAAITFDVNATDLGFEMCMPPKNTLSDLLVNKNVATLPSVILHGSYTYCSEVKRGLTETLLMEIIGRGLEIQFYGFLGRHLAKIKENYFGETVHFRTLEEYQDLVRNNFEGADKNQPAIGGNDLDVVLDITAEDVNILLPAGLYNADEYIKVHVDDAAVDLRVNNYYLELMVNSYPIEFSFTARTSSESSRNTAQYIRSGTQLLLDGLAVSGHRLFGLPPSEPAYMSNWDIDAGSITGECQPLFFEKLVAAGQSAALSVQDHENAVPIPHSLTVHDSTFVRFNCSGLKVWCPVERLVFLLSFGNISGNFNDLAGRLFSQRLNMSAPDLLVGCYDATSSSRRHDEKRPSRTFAHVKTSVQMNMVQRQPDFRRDRELQQQHLRSSDAYRGLRATFMYDDGSTAAARPNASISLPLPTLPVPLVAGPSQRREADRTGPSKHAPDLPPNNPNSDLSYQRGHKLQPSSRFSTVSERRQSHQRQLATHIPLSSPFKLPSLKYDELQPDLSDIPDLSCAVSIPSSPMLESDAQLDVDDAIDDDTVHTTIMLRCEPGITAFCDAEAVRSIAGLVKDIVPKDPSQVLDALHIRTLFEVLATNSHDAGNNSITDVTVHLPRLHARFVNSFALDAEPGEQRSDRYNVVAAELGLSLRTKQVPLPQNEADATSVHATLSRLTINAFEGSSKLDQEGAALESHVDQILVWLNTSDRTSINASFQKFEAALASQKVDYLASLIHRTTMLGDELQRRFLTIIEEQDRRLQYLAFVLTDQGGRISDPQFLTRPSYVIRSSNEHIRNSDSWKILSRWQYVLRALPSQQLQDIADRCRRLDFTLESDAESATLAKLDTWRAWDAIRVRECYAIRIVYASTAEMQGLHDRSRVPIDVSLRAAIVRLAIDPGPSETSFSLDQLTCGVAIAPPPPQSAMQLFHEYSEVKSNVIQFKLAKLSMRVDWSVHRLVDQVLTLFETTAPQPLEAGTIVHKPAADLAASETFHIVFCSDKLQIDVVTISASQQLMITDLKTSVVGTGWSNPGGPMSANTMTSASALNLNLKGHEKDLLKLDVTSPVLWVAYDQSSRCEASSDTIKVAGDSKEITLKTKDEVIGFVEVAHALTEEEVATVQALVERHKDFGSRVTAKEHPTQRSNPLRADIALFLNVYTIEVTLLSGLVYSTTGRTIRLAAAPRASSKTAYHMDFDLKAQTHSLLQQNSAGTSSISHLQMPAINGSLNLTISGTSYDASAMLSIEKINIEGTALYDIASTLGSQSVADGFKAVKEDVASVRSRIAQRASQDFARKEARGPREERSRAAPIITFDACIALAGLAVSADAPPSRPGAASTNLLFDLQSMHVRSGNRVVNAENGDGILPFPSFKFGIDEISAELREANDGQLKLAGRLVLNVLLTCVVERQADLPYERRFALSLTGPVVETGPLTGPLLVDMLSHMQGRVRNMDPSTRKRYVRRLKHLDSKISKQPRRESRQSSGSSDDSKGSQMTTAIAFDLRSLCLSYIVGDAEPSKRNASELHDLVLSLEKIELVTRSQAEAKLNLKNLQLALKLASDTSNMRAATSALMPEVAFHVGHKATKTERKFLFQAAGKALDVQLDSQFLLPLSDIERSLTITSTQTRAAVKRLDLAPRASAGVDPKKLLGERNLSSLIVDADFAGAVVSLRPGHTDARRNTLGASRFQRGRYGHFAGEEGASAVLRAPGIKLKVEYADPVDVDPTLNVELRINASSNELSPSVVPLILQMSDSVKRMVRDDEEVQGQQPSHSEEVESNAASAYFDPEQTLVKADPKALLGKTQLNIGIRICKQQFSLGCQPIAKVAASARFDDIYITINNIDSDINNDHFFAASATFKGLNATLQHVYSRTITFSFDMESIFLSVMNSKHISGSNGISVILKINPTKTQLNAKQLQDLLLFREIWFPLEMRNTNTAAVAIPSSNAKHDYFMHRYQQIAASTAFSWNATFSIAELVFDLDLGQSIGKISSNLSNLWINSSKSSRARQNLCIGIDSVDVSSSGRLSGFVDLDQLRVRTSIAWPAEEQPGKAPIIQGAVGFERLCVKAAFDYQAFAVADVTSFEFIMYNVRDESQKTGDRLVAILDGDKVNVYCIASSAALGFSLYQAFERLIQEKKTSFQQSLNDIEAFLRRRSTVTGGTRASSTVAAAVSKKDKDSTKTPISLHTDVVLTLRSVDVGAFPSTLLDQQILRFEASDVQARFAAVQEEGRLHSGLGLTLGQLRVALASTPQASMPKTLGEITIEEVVKNAHSARGGVILRVPKVVAAMQTWQESHSNNIEYIFRSSFEGKIDVGWNYSRISFIRGMYNTHTRTLATRLGKPLPEPAVKVKGAPEAPIDGTTEAQATAKPSTPTGAAKEIFEKMTADSPSFSTPPRPPGAQSKQDSAAGSMTSSSSKQQQKITIEPSTSLPDSKYTYIPLEAPIIETPQLRDMGEATPPLEWVGLNREKLPNVTHQVVIVALLGVVREVEDAYLGVLGGA